ncbi:MAG: RecB family exonuclease, partial [Verrucomicrobiota bacterium]
RFYLKRILGMEACDDRKRELDPRDFGTICHSALKSLGHHSELRNSTNPDSIAAYLIETARRILEIQYGHQPPAAVTIQLDSVIQRLRAAAEVQARLCADGWEIIAAEVPLDPSRATRFSPLPIRGTVDRVDRHPDGRIRLLDYKTTDSPHKPADTHWGPVRKTTADFAFTSDGKKERAWTDLQLPLYALLCDSVPDGAIPECGYFNLPKAVTQTGIQLWDNLTAAHLQSAARCAAGVAQSILDGVFWPPAETLQYDDFESLLFGNPAETAAPPPISPRK